MAAGSTPGGAQNVNRASKPIGKKRRARHSRCSRRGGPPSTDGLLTLSARLFAPGHRSRRHGQHKAVTEASTKTGGGDWVHENVLTEDRNIFKKHHVGLAQFIELTHDDLKELKIKVGDRKRVLG